MLRVGITGGIGSGKTIASKIFSSLGIPVFNSDYIAKKITETDKEVVSKIKALFGKNLFDSNNLLDRKALTKLVFKDKNALYKLNEVIHPRVANAFKKWVNEISYKPYIIKESAILFETEIYKQLDKVITVTAPVNLRIKRIKKRDNISETSIKQRIKSQMSEQEKISLSDFIIRNDDTKLLIPQVLRIHKVLLNS